ncbi:hypothetical protein [Proteus terrae]|uniref:hypothetical protein n=1 Tax=Proteus terrae TaxID=1574161 RepID=UPI0034D64515
MSQWIKYSEQKPEKEGVYLWRMDSETVKGEKVIARKRMRSRGAGYQSVLSPEFDYWDGYRLHVPDDLEWMEDDETKPEIAFTGLEVISECPFCKKAPLLHAYSNFVLPRPQSLSRFTLKCCAWNGSPTYGDPRELIKRWNSAVSK